MLSLLLSTIRLIVFVIFISVLSLSFYIASLFWNEKTTNRNALIMRDFIIKTINRILGIRAIVYGDIPTTQGLIVANHRSYFDPILIVSHLNAFPVGKKKLLHGL